MRAFERVLEDVRKGENIDLYVTAAAAVALALMNVFGVVPASSVSPLTLAILGLLSVTILGNRHRLDEIRAAVAALSGHSPPFLDEFPPDFGTRLDEAHEVWLSGTHLSAALTAYHHVFERKIRGGGKLKFLLVAPDGAAHKMAAMRFPGRVSPEQERMRIQSSLQTLTELRELAPDNVEIRVIDFLVDYTAYVLDPDAVGGVIYLERCTYKTSGGSRKPKFVYKKRDGRWFEHVRTELGYLWDSATDWTPEPNSRSAS